MYLGDRDKPEGVALLEINKKNIFIGRKMDETKVRVSVKCVPERLTLGITRILENMPGVADVRLAEREPGEKRSLLSWEQKNNCILPEDLRDFYLTTDGFTLTWSVKLDDECVPLGCMTINSVGRLQPLLQPTQFFSLPNAPSLADLDWEEGSAEWSENTPTPPHFDSRSRIFELDSCGGNGQVCLVYKNTTPGVVAQQNEIWFLDRSLSWHFLTATFSSYYRLMITHLGLPEWQYFFTPYGPSPQAKQWSSLYQPLTFRSELSLTPSAGDVHVNKIDPTKAFKAKAKVPTPKKKPSAPSSQASNSKSPGSSGRPGTAKR
ncbi:tubulin polyglutamylase complex subunit 2 isoform X2 [Syngnathus acus]|uniref:tubulin polyglutamylase complex subunit 2 isoform X2 n=1 Tax=Syngnathus acus TaxID=161584 RepID=UPI0018860F65|nr:tubulin polyglutamylase complex subunit 2 isoform X2 [Syngnathus acus]